MSIKKNDRIDWNNNQYLLYILFSIMKHYMITNNLTDVPCQESDQAVQDCAALMSMITEEKITPGQVGSQLWLQADKPSFGKIHFRNIKIAIDVGLIDENNFAEVILETRARMERNKNK